MFGQGTGRWLVVVGNIAVDSRDRLVGGGLGELGCCVGGFGPILFKSVDAVMVTKDTDGDEGVRIELGEDMGRSGGWWKVRPINGSGSGGLDMVTVGKFDCNRGCRLWWPLVWRIVEEMASCSSIDDGCGRSGDESVGKTYV